MYTVSVVFHLNKSDFETSNIKHCALLCFLEARPRLTCVQVPQSPFSALLQVLDWPNCCGFGANWPALCDLPESERPASRPDYSIVGNCGTRLQRIVCQALQSLACRYLCYRSAHLPGRTRPNRVARLCEINLFN